MCGGNPEERERIAADREANTMQMEELRAQREMAFQGQMMSAAQGAANAQLQAWAMMNQSKQSSMGGIIAGAMAAKESRIQHKQWLPSEVQAEFMRAFDMQQKWTKTMDMQIQGYQPVAIDYELSRKNHRSLYKDPMWNSMRMMETSKNDIMASIEMFGVKSAQNPGGVNMSKNEFIKLHSMKNPMEMLEVDPQEAAKRVQAYNQWKADMKAQGLGLVVDIFEHPQTGGSGIMTMKGEDPLIDPSLAPLLKEMLDDPMPKFKPIDMPNMDFGGGPGAADAIDAQIAEYKQVLADGYSNKDSPGPDLYDEGRLGNDERRRIEQELKLLEGRKQQALNAGANNQNRINNNNTEMQNFMDSLMPEMPDDPADWDAIIESLTTGKETKYTKQIEHLMSEGVIDKYGFVNAGKLMSYMPKGLLDAPEFNMFKELTPEQQRALEDKWDQIESGIIIDPKLIQEKLIGAGISRKVKLNADGSIAGTALSGMMPDMMGNMHNVTLAGMNRLQDWYDRMSMIDGMSPTFPGAAAPVTADELAGRPFAGFFGPQDQNPNYVANAGNKGQPGQYKPATKVTMASASAGTQASVGTASSNNPAESVGGAPLAQGE